MNKYILKILMFLCMLATFPMQSYAQMRYIRGLQGKDSLAMGKVLLGSLIVPGYGQAYNRDYWKIPVLYGGMGVCIASGIRFNSKLKDAKMAKNMIAQSEILGFPEDLKIEIIKKYQYEAQKYDSYKQKRDLSYIGAGIFYLAGAIDAVSSYKTNKGITPVSPQRATIYSALVPGLGQAYNSEYWKIPIIYGGFGICIYWYNFCDDQYKRYRTAYNIKYANDNGTSTAVDEFNGRYSATTLKHARDVNRRNRDMTFLVTGLFYALNVIDANVFAHLKQFDVSDNLSMKIEPTLVNETNFATGNISPTVGFKLKIKF